MKLRELIERATPGPWTHGGAEDYGYGWVRAPDGVLDTIGSPLTVLGGQYSHMVHDAALICELRNNASALADLIEAAERVRRADIDNWGADGNFATLNQELLDAHAALYAALSALER